VVHVTNLLKLFTFLCVALSAGRFMRHFCSTLTAECLRDPSHPLCPLLLPISAIPALPIDLGVYTRHRCFRLFLSSKHARPLTDSMGSKEENPILVLAAGNMHRCSGELRNVFMHSLIGLVRAERWMRFDENGETSLIHADKDISAPSSTSPSPRSATFRPRPSSSVSSATQVHTGPSPFPNIASFVQSHLASLHAQHKSSSLGCIKGWTWFREEGRHSASFTVSNARYCENIGREHKSNGLYYVVDLLSYTMQQRCFDSECKYFRSAPITLPRWVVELDLQPDDEEEDGEAEGKEEKVEKEKRVATQPVPSSLIPDDDDLDYDALAELEQQIKFKGREDNSK